MYNKPKKFIDFIVNLKQKIHPEKALYLPGVCNSANIAFLIYSGIDMFDSSQAIISARNNNLFYESGEINKSKIDEIQCNCPICTNLDNSKEYDFKKILFHNYYTLDAELKLVRNAIKNANLRNLIEKKVRFSTHLTTMLRYLDQYYYEYLEENIPTADSAELIATTKESIYRPEIKRFQERLINNFKKPKSAKVLLLLPCSAKKPYSFSKSHKLFKKQIIKSKNPFVIHELIVTSPMGLVPRELELVYPASSYDISVTGFWEEYEKDMIISLFDKYLKKNKYEKIIVHLPEDITEFIDPLMKNSTITCINHPTSKESLENLEKTIENIVKNYDKVSLNTKSKEEIEE
jgi:archaeosine synthase